MTVAPPAVIDDGFLTEGWRPDGALAQTAQALAMRPADEPAPEPIAFGTSGQWTFGDDGPDAVAEWQGVAWESAALRQEGRQ